MHLITKTLRKYEDISGQKVNKEKSSIYLHEDISGQKVNKEKSSIYLHHSVSRGDIIVVEVATGILRK